jgi:hypothetical protein
LELARLKVKLGGINARLFSTLIATITATKLAVNCQIENVKGHERGLQSAVSSIQGNRLWGVGSIHLILHGYTPRVTEEKSGMCHWLRHTPGSIDDGWKAVGPIVSASSEATHLDAFTAHHEPEAIMFDFMDPLRT